MTTLSVKVKVVNVLATVRDKHGKIVNGLTKDDFTLTEDGRPQTLKYFARETDLPLTLGMLVDTSMSQRRVLSEERDASESFLAQVLREDQDKAFVIHFDHEVELLQDLTASHEQLRSALESLQTPEFTRTSNGGGGGGPGSGRGRGSGRRGGGTLLYDAVYLASDEMMKKQPGRKAVIVLSDGVDMGSKESLESAIESAQRANTIVYSILFKDDEAYGNGGGFGRTGISIPGMGGPGMGRGGMGGGRGGRRFPEEHADGKKVLERISKETGGRLFQVSKKEPVNQIYSQIQEELRNQYSLGYTPNPLEARIPQDSGRRHQERSRRPGPGRILRRQINLDICLRLPGNTFWFCSLHFLFPVFELALQFAHFLLSALPDDCAVPEWLPQCWV